jgi:hypothetical protein
MQVVVDWHKQFLDVTVGMPRSIHDLQMLRRSALYQQAQSSTLFNSNISVEGFISFLLGDAWVSF